MGRPLPPRSSRWWLRRSGGELPTKRQRSSPTTSLTQRLFPHAEEVVAIFLTALDFLPAKARHIHHAQDLPALQVRLLVRPRLHLIRLNVLVPIVCSPRNHAQYLFRHELGSEPAGTRARDRGADEPASRLEVLQDGAQERRRLLDVLNHLEERDDVEAFFWCLGQGKRLNGNIVVCETARLKKQRIGALVALCDGDDLGRRINGRDRVCCGKARSRFSEDASSAANVEVLALVARRKRWCRAQAAVDERVPVLVQEMEQSARALRIPPFGGQGVEVGDFRLVDRATDMARIGRVGVGGVVAY